jgi:hypothetical protein
LGDPLFGDEERLKYRRQVWWIKSIWNVIAESTFKKNLQQMVS